MKFNAIRTFRDDSGKRFSRVATSRRSCKMIVPGLL